MEFLHLFRINLQSTTSRKPDNITVLPTEHIIPAVSIKTSYHRHEITPPVLSSDSSLQAEPVPEPSLYPWPERPSSSTANLVRASPARLFSSRTPTETGTVMTTNGMNPGYEIGEKTNPHTSLLGNPKRPAIPVQGLRGMPGHAPSQCLTCEILLIFEMIRNPFTLCLTMYSFLLPLRPYQDHLIGGGSHLFSEPSS